MVKLTFFIAFVAALIAMSHVVESQEEKLVAIPEEPDVLYPIDPWYPCPYYIYDCAPCPAPPVCDCAPCNCDIIIDDPVPVPLPAEIAEAA